jgi:hypothetical protein
MKFFFIALILLQNLYASPELNIIKKENKDSNTTLLVIGGIHGNEPGGYFAPAILASHYDITSKNLWIIPNLNKKSIIAFKRGINGDMNRKFASIKKNDKDKEVVEAIKKIILKPQVSLVLNLHDGHGFYRKKYKGSIFNPNAWGQTCVIDQCKLKTQQAFGNLNDIANEVRKNVNKRLLKKHHSFNVKNTKTKYEDEAMQLSLTYFAVTHNKPAFAIETSKNLSTLSLKVFYQLLAIEEFMDIMGIKYHRDFELNAKNIEEIVRKYGNLEINHNILLNLNNIKKSLSYIPIKSKSNEFHFSHPLGMAVKRKDGTFDIYIGHKKLTKLRPQYFKIAKECKDNYQFEVDGEKISVKKASIITINDDFKVVKDKNYRVNIIGFHAKNKDESDITISLSQLNKQYSVDKNGKSYRVEFYKNDKFCTMIVAKFK